ncbi:MAG: hypothetical protein ACT4ON_16390 [Bacteroidota bacterium]
MISQTNKTLYLIIGLVIVTFFSIFSFETFNYELIKDDAWFVDLLSDKGVGEVVVHSYLNVNGRWFSHLWDSFVFKLFFHHNHLFFIYHFFLLACFILSLALFLRVFFQKQYSVIISYSRSLLLSISLTAFFFFFFFEGRVEVWYWVTATGVHLLSLIALLVVISYCIKNELKVTEIILLIVSAMAIGGMSESYAIMSLIALIIIALKKRASFKKTYMIAGLILLSLLVNILSSGLQSRLSMLPDFNFLLAVRNTIHSMLLPFIRYQYLPLKVAMLILTYLLALRIGNLSLLKKEKFLFGHFLRQLLIVISIIAFSFFVPCFLLTDIIAYRMESWGYLCFLLFIFNYFTKYAVNSRES